MKNKVILTIIPLLLLASCDSSHQASEQNNLLEQKADLLKQQQEQLNIFEERLTAQQERLDRRSEQIDLAQSNLNSKLTETNETQLSLHSGLSAQHQKQAELERQLAKAEEAKHSSTLAFENSKKQKLIAEKAIQNAKKQQAEANAIIERQEAQQKAYNNLIKKYKQLQTAHLELQQSNLANTDNTHAKAQLAHARKKEHEQVVHNFNQLSKTYNTLFASHNLLKQKQTEKDLKIKNMELLLKGKNTSGNVQQELARKRKHEQLVNNYNQLTTSHNKLNTNYQELLKKQSAKDQKLKNLEALLKQRKPQGVAEDERKAFKKELKLLLKTIEEKEKKRLSLEARLGALEDIIIENDKEIKTLEDTHHKNLAEMALLQAQLDAADDASTPAESKKLSREEKLKRARRGIQ